MAYSSKTGKRPNEYASKSSHSHIINDSSVQQFLANCDMPKHAEEIDFSEDHVYFHFTPPRDNPINHIIAVDGGYTEVIVQPEFPSATIGFFQIGALIFSIDDLENLDVQPFINPSDISKLKNIQRLKLTIPIKNIVIQGEPTLTSSVRRSLYDFFRQDIEDETLIDTLRWFIFQEFGSQKLTWNLSSCPVCEHSNIELSKKSMSNQHTFGCPYCDSEIFLTDVFRLHEAIDDELGAGGVLGYITTTLEQIVFVHLIRIMLKTKPDLLKHVLLIKDGPLAFFGQTANMHIPMRGLITFLLNSKDLFMAGLEKSGPFVEHAHEIYDIIDNGSILLLNNEYIYKYVMPGIADPKRPYGSTTYYSNKLIFKTRSGSIYVVSVPTTDILPFPHEADLQNLPVILTNIEKLKCDMYDNALLPVALANKLVSLSNHPSSRILQKFATQSIH